ncbi:MAG: ABC transporter ATP-binding protein [Thiolinea sp.]
MPLLSAQTISLHFGSRPILDQVSLDLHAGELVGLVGPNGAGKSTLLQIMAGLLPADQGSVLCKDQPLQHMDHRERSRRIAWLEQYGQINWPLSVQRLVALGRLPHLAGWQQPGPDDAAAIEQALRETDSLHLLRT